MCCNFKGRFQVSPAHDLYQVILVGEAHFNHLVEVELFRNRSAVNKLLECVEVDPPVLLAVDFGKAEYPERDLAPLWPRAAVPPLPDPWPRPTVFPAL